MQKEVLKSYKIGRNFCQYKYDKYIAGQVWGFKTFPGDAPRECFETPNLTRYIFFIFILTKIAPKERLVLKFCMLIYPSLFQNWWVFVQSLFIFLFWVILTLWTRRIWGFWILSGTWNLKKVYLTQNSFAHCATAVSQTGDQKVTPSRQATLLKVHVHPCISVTNKVREYNNAVSLFTPCLLALIYRI